MTLLTIHNATLILKCFGLNLDSLGKCHLRQSLLGLPMCVLPNLSKLLHGCLQYSECNASLPGMRIISVLFTNTSSVKNILNFLDKVNRAGIIMIPVLHLKKPLLWHVRKWKVKVAQSCPTLCDPVGHTVHGILYGIL